MRLGIVLLTVAAVVSGSIVEKKSRDLDLDFDIDDETTENPSSVGNREQALQASLLRAMQKPAVREQMGEVIPIIRVMSPQQRLTLAALVSAQIMTPQHAEQQTLTDVAQMFSSPGQSAKNVSEQLLLPISMDIAKMFKGIAGEAGRSWRSTPTAWEKQAMAGLEAKTVSFFTPAPAYTKRNSSAEKGWKKPTTRSPNDINRRNGVEDLEVSPGTQDCDFLTSDMCQEVSFYPEEEIMGSIQKHLSLMEPFLNEFGDMQEDRSESPRLQRRRDDGNDLGTGDGYMCPSTVKYAKPKRARTTAGAWKYIVNTGDYTQTLRLEICHKNGASCSYLNDHLRSVCNQVYNYHRLMCWDEKRGLHMDVFKVPSCCSCHVQGYATKYPPQDFTFAEKRREVLQPQPQSNSGVKREIPRPTNLRENVPVIRQPEFFEDDMNQRVFQRPPNRPHQRPQPFLENPRRQNEFRQQHLANNVDGGLVDHLVPPGPPLPLDFDRPRPGFEQRKPNATLHRKPDQNVIVEPTRNRGQQRYEPSPNRQKRPVIEPSAAPAENQRVQFKPTEGGFGSKIRGKPQKPVFVTPTPIPINNPENFENAVHVTPKSPNAPKKVNYNYHPIIDFFTRDSQAVNEFNQYGSAHKRQDNHAEPEFTGFSQPEAPQRAHAEPEFSGFSQPEVPQRAESEHSGYSRPDVPQGAHEWTPMV